VHISARFNVMIMIRTIRRVQKRGRFAK